jgi:molybdate transport system substrate-binding protein
VIAATVFAAASLTSVFPAIDAHAHYSFAGSNTLAAQIAQGAPADVFASADMRLPRMLHRKGLADRPVVFTRNALVLVTPHSNPKHIDSVYDLRRRGIKLVLADRGVPAGDYARDVLRRVKLGAALRNVVSNEGDVRGVLAKVALGEADAGFVYATDAASAGDQVISFDIPHAREETTTYPIATLDQSDNAVLAREFVDLVLGSRGQRILADAGFSPAP